MKFESTDVLEMSSSGNNSEGIRQNVSCHKSVSSITENERDGSLSHLRGWKSQLRTECVQTYKVRFYFF